MVVTKKEIGTVIVGIQREWYRQVKKTQNPQGFCLALGWRSTPPLEFVTLKLIYFLLVTRIQVRVMYQRARHVQMCSCI